MSQKTRETGIYGTGFSNTRGGFERLIIDGVSLDEAEVRRRVESQPLLLAAIKRLRKVLEEGGITMTADVPVMLEYASSCGDSHAAMIAAWEK